MVTVRSGQSVLEVLVALTLLALIFSGAALVIFGNKSTLTDKKLASEAESYATEGVEAVKSIALRDWTALSAGEWGVEWNTTSSAWEFISASTTRNSFARGVSIATEQNDEIKTITSHVSWAVVNSQRTFSSRLVLRLTDWQGVVDTGGDTGGTGTVPDWTTACTLGSVSLSSGSQGTDVDVIGMIVYLTASQSNQSKPDFAAVDATDGNNPVLLAEVDMGSGLNALDAVVGYAYAAQADQNTQLHIIDISNASAPTTTAQFSLEGIGGAGAEGLSIYYRNNLVYIGTEAANGPEFHIVDVADPANPFEVSSKEVGASVNAIHVRSGKAYLATGLNDKELLVYDVSDAENITEIGSFNATSTNDGLSLWVVGNMLYLGRAGDGSASNHEFLILDISDIENITLAGSKEIGNDVLDVRVRDTFAFLGTDEANEEFKVYDINDPANITLRTSFNFPQENRGIDYESNRVYAAVRSNDTLRIITSECN